MWQSPERLLVRNVHNLHLAELLDLSVKLFNDLLSLLHDIEVGLVHIVGLEHVFRVDPLLHESSDLLIQEVAF